MTFQEFENILACRLNAIQTSLGEKARGYAFNDDRLYNFKVGARINNESPVDTLWGYATKHLVSVVDLVEGRLPATKENIDEKVGDLINYLILLEALLKEDAENRLTRKV